MNLKQHPSLYIVFGLVGFLLVWAITIFWLSPPPIVQNGVRAGFLIMVLWALAPLVLFAIEDYVLKLGPISKGLQRYAHALWLAIGAITFVLTIRAIVVSQFATMNRGPVAWNVVADVIRVAIWPTVVLLSLAVFREPLGAFFTALGTRASKIGAFNVSIELANLPEARPWSGPGLNDIRSEYPTTAADSSGSLFKAIADTTHADYLTVNLENGNAWLTSRLFVLASLIPRIRPIKRIVFLSDPAEKYIGEARPSDVAAALASKYPWLEKAYVSCHVYANAKPNANGCELVHTNTLLGQLEPIAGANILSIYLEHVKGTAEPTGWVKFTHYSEHAEWLTVESLIQLLGKKLNPYIVKRDPGADEADSTRILLRTEADFVAIVDTSDRFQHLIDRNRALDQVVRQQTATAS